MQARLRAQLGDRSKYSGERRRRSGVVASIVLTITDPLRGSYPLYCYLQAALIRSCGASFACMELTIISRFQRLQASTKFLIPFTIRQQCIIYPQHLSTESHIYICDVCVGGGKKGKKRGICSVVLKNVLTLHPKMIVYNHPNDCI